MSRLELLDFQQNAVNQLVQRAVQYFADGPDKAGGRVVPFIAQLKAVTGAGKTPILASVIGQLSPAIVLWTTKFTSVVDQTATNLRAGGKYHHLLGKGVEVVKFSEIPSAVEWHHILERKDKLTILISTVAAWYSSEKDDRLNVHRINPDWGDKSRWDQMRFDRKRPLWIVYDEAHNTTTEQIEQLDELDPNGFFVASASPVKGKLQQYLTLLPEDVRKQRFVPVRTKDVVDAQLLKSTIAVADYDSSTEEMLSDVVKRRKQLEKALQQNNSPTVPKAIYVVEASNTKSNGEPRPVVVWNALVKHGIKPAQIAVCTNTKNLPAAAVRVQTIEQLGPEFTHIIFNKKLQEGWDDPSVYVCYFDGKTDSATRIQQVIGRALRQPDAKHLSDDDLNTAFFYINCPNEALEHIVDELKEELRIYKGDDDPEDFEPFQIKELKKVVPRISVRKEHEGKLRVPNLQLELPAQDYLGKLLKKKTFDFSEEERAAPGKALIQIVSIRTGDVKTESRDLFEDMRVRCGAYLYQQIRALSKDAASAMKPELFANDKLDKTACYNSKALNHYRELAMALVEEYENHVRLTELADESERYYVVGPYQPSGQGEKKFDHSAHARYDPKAFASDPELKMAKALDKFPKYVWARNKARLDYGIPLPKKGGASATFYPDFLWWVKKTVWAIDPTGKFILEEKIRTKLFAVPAPLKIVLITPGKYDGNHKTDEEGWTLSRFRMGSTGPEVFDDLQELLETLVAES